MWITGGLRLNTGRGSHAFIHPGRIPSVRAPCRQGVSSALLLLLPIPLSQSFRPQKKRIQHTVCVFWKYPRFPCDNSPWLEFDTNHYSYPRSCHIMYSRHFAPKDLVSTSLLTKLIVCQVGPPLLVLAELAAIFRRSRFVSSTYLPSWQVASHGKSQPPPPLHSPIWPFWKLVSLLVLARLVLCYNVILPSQGVRPFFLTRHVGCMRSSPPLCTRPAGCSQLPGE